MKRLSCGILILSERAELLLCHATGTFHWDIPKGGMDPGETPLQTAIRETREECGLAFEADALTDLGHHGYRPNKDLHLFAVRVERFDLGRCHCSSHYRDRWGRDRPEMDDFAWVSFDHVHRRCARHMAALLTQTIALPALLARLG
jgi:putative (di)nucleoside polyphosphate hydrolase